MNTAAAHHPPPRPSRSELLGLQHQARRLRSMQRHQSHRNPGQRQTRRHGRGMDFQESRVYQPGDDCRHLDWRVTARTGVAHTKRYGEERQRPLVLIIDANASLFFGTRVTFKSVIAARLATLLGWMALQQGDRVGAVFYAGDRQQWLPVQAGRRGVMALIQGLLDWFAPDPLPMPQPSAGGLSAVLQRLDKGPTSSGLMILISDFQHREPSLETHLARLRQRHDVSAYQIADPLELTLPAPGRYPVSVGTQLRVLDWRQRRQRQAWQAQQQAQQRQWAELWHRHGIPWHTVTTEQQAEQVLIHPEP